MKRSITSGFDLHEGSNGTMSRRLPLQEIVSKGNLIMPPLAPRIHRAGRGLLWGAIFLQLLMLLISMSEELRNALVFLTDGDRKVLGSPYAWFARIPVPLIGIIVTILAIHASGGTAIHRSFANRTYAWLIVLGAEWFVFVQAFIVHAWSPLCCLSNLLVSVGSILVAIRIRPQRQQNLKRNSAHEYDPFIGPMLVALTLVMIFAVFQMIAVSHGW